MRADATSMIVFCFCWMAGQGAELMAQVALSRQVIGSFGQTSPAGQDIEVSYTGGEPAVQTLVGTQYTLTQGFHQPVTFGALRFELVTGYTSCPSAADGFAEVIQIMGCTPPYVITWSNGETGARNERLTTGLQSVTVSAEGCEVTREFEIISDPVATCRLHFFNAFSPNGDGINDTWEIENIDLPEFRTNKVEIFNRWGQLVWSGQNYDNSRVRWDGTSRNGNELPNGTYFFIASVAAVMHKGYIELTK